ncbi:MAG: TerB family tellurite resistance protein [Planctomycetota bacterium]|nr:TerB family tellurite resistance protein [Planctomycetota bacterium]
MSEAIGPFVREEVVQFCRVLAHLVAADHKITSEERSELFNVIAGTGLSPDDPDVAKAVEAELAKPTPLPELLKPITSPGMRRTLYRACIEIALSDGLHPNEEQKLAQVAKEFGLHEAAAKDLIKWTLDSIALEKRETEIMNKL